MKKEYKSHSQKKKSRTMCPTDGQLLIYSLSPGTSWKFLDREIFHKLV